MKIGINARTFVDEEPDGAVQTATNIARKLADREDCEILLYGHRDLTEQFDALALESSLYASVSPFFGVVWERTVLPYLASRDNLDVLLCPNGNAPMTADDSYLTAMYIHDVNALEGHSSSIHGLYRRTAVPIGARNADVILTVSDFSRSEILSHIDVPKDRVETVYNGINDIYHRESGAESFDLPEKYLLYVGSMNPRKNIEGLLDAFQQFKRRTDSDHKLVLIGPENKVVYQRFEPGVDRDDIVTPGFIPIEQLKYAYQNADLFLYLSFYEGFGLPPLEAMACGTPVLASDTTSLPEVLGSAAALVDPEDTDAIAETIREILADDRRRSALSKQGTEWASSFTWDRTAQELIDILSERLALRAERTLL